MAIKAIIFDFGNVIGFFDHRRATQRLAAESGVPEDLLFRQFLDAELEDAYEAGRLRTPDFLAHLCKVCGLTTPHARLGDLYADIFWPNPEVCDLLPQLRGRYRLLLGSNTTELHSQRFRQQFADTLGHLDDLVLSWEIGVRKPHAGFFKHCHKLAGCAPAECLFIDDLEANIAGAQAVGLQGLVYRSDNQLRAHLQHLGIDLSAS